MASSVRTKPLTLCISRCAELIHDLNDVPHFQGLQQQVKALLSSLLSMMRAAHPDRLDNLQSDPSYSPGLSLLAAYLCELGKTCGYYGTGTGSERQLSEKDRAFVLDEIDNPFDRLSIKLSCLAQTLQELVDDEQIDYETKMERLCEWTESIFTHWNFFQGEFEAARTLAAATSSASEDRSAARSTTTNDDSVYLSSAGTPQMSKPQKTSIWDKIGEYLAEEGIQDDAIENVARDLRACARNLVRGERPKFRPVLPRIGTDIRQSTEVASKKANIPASDILKNLSGASVEPSSKKTKTPTSAKPKAAITALEDWFNRDFVSSKMIAALDKIKTDFTTYLPEICVVAFKQETEKDTRNYCQALDLIYTMACRDTSRSKIHARLAKELQAKTPAQIRSLMASKEIGIAQSDKEPVTGYLLCKCSEDWYHGKHGNNKISVENFALGLSDFIGDLAKQGVFNAEHVHSFVRVQWGPTLKRNQFMAVYKLLRATGPMLDSQKDTSDMEDHFKRIAGLRDKKKTPGIVKELAQELASLRSSGWKKQTKVMNQVEEAIRKKM